MRTGLAGQPPAAGAGQDDLPDAIPEGIVPEHLPLEQEPPPLPEPRLRGLRAMFLGWFRPATTARRTAHLPLLAAYGIHWLGALLTCAVMLLMTGIIQAAIRDGGRGAVGEALHLFGEIAEEFTRHPQEAILVTAGILAFVEASFILLPFVLQAWGARDEPLRDTYRNALRQFWLHSADGIPGIIAIGLISAPLWRARSEYYRSRGYRGWDMMPWYLRYDDEILVAIGFLFGLHLLWVWYRAIGADRRVNPPARPPTCELCGYTLVGLPYAGRCPECGEPVIRSLSRSTRTGVPWQFRRSLGVQNAYLSTAWAFFVRPAELGRQLITRRRQTDHRLFMALHLPVAFVLGWFGICGIYRMDMNRWPLPHEPEVFWMGGPLTGIITALIILLLAPICATLVGLMLHPERRRNLSSVAMQAAGYGTPFLMLVLLISGISIMGILAFKRDLRTLGRQWMMDWELMAFGIWCVPITVGLIWYFVRIHRATAAARYANY